MLPPSEKMPEARLCKVKGYLLASAKKSGYAVGKESPNPYSLGRNSL